MLICFALIVPFFALDAVTRAPPGGADLPLPQDDTGGHGR